MTLSESIRHYALAKGHFDNYRMPMVESTVLFAFGDHTSTKDLWVRNFNGELVYNTDMDTTLRTFAVFVAEAVVS